MIGQQQRRRRDAEVNRDCLLEAALAALLEDPDTGLDAVASSAGLSRRTIYSHFASREALIAALADRAGEHLADVVRLVRTTITEDEHPLTTLARLEVQLWRRIERYRLLGSLAIKAEHRTRVMEHTSGVRALRMELVEAGRSLGALRDGMPTEAMGRLLQAIPAAVFDAVLEGDLAPADAARVAALTALAVAGAQPAQAEHHVTVALAAEPTSQELS
jgi:AcrR family transcriptional regulator